MNALYWDILILVACMTALWFYVIHLHDRIEKLERHVHSADELAGTTNGPQEPSAQP